MAKTIGKDSPVLEAMRYYGADITREEYLACCYPGEELPEALPEGIEDDLPVQFRRAALNARPESEKLQ